MLVLKKKVFQLNPTERQNKILKAITEEYIRTGQPVGSLFLSETLTMKISPATVRSEMAHLYELGYLEQPHTSAGRVPSHLGIRQYVDSLMKPKELSSFDKGQIAALFRLKNPDLDHLLSDAALSLSEYSGYTAIVSSSVESDILIHSLELVQAGTQTFVLVLIANNGMIRSKVCHVDFQITEELTVHFYQFLNSQFSGKSLRVVDDLFIHSIGSSLDFHVNVFESLLLSVYELCHEVTRGQCYIKGGAHMLRYQDQNNPMSKDILEMFEDPYRLNHLFQINQDQTTVLIGKENWLTELVGASVIISHYHVGTRVAGSVGLIGPTQIDYSNMIPQLEYFAEKLGNLVEQTLEPLGNIS